MYDGKVLFNVSSYYDNQAEFKSSGDKAARRFKPFQIGKA
jgi:hypothetical protein